MKKPLVILTGPTAVGKTALSIELAKKINASIISADSMQVYKEMNIGTDKIKPENMGGIKHYLVDEYEPEFNFSVSVFKDRANECIEEIYSEGKIPLIVGGTGFYIQAVLKNVDFTETNESLEYRAYLQKLEDNEKGCLHNMLKKIDEEAAVSIHPNNVKRIIRALEYNHFTGQLISEHNKREKDRESPYNYAYFCLNDERHLLYERIEKRIDEMIEEGLVEEVKALKNRGLNKEFTSMKGLGYKEILDYLDGETTLEEAFILLKKSTRHFAKRQLTWFNHEKDVIMVNKNEYNYDNNKILEYITGILKEKNII
ncbi:tRNA dimethylallyltransferase [Acetitomaculum ruminis DSM 5522]|uniref:tRNA dimethylallyltransferase n=1 Tax=Acetitomaculum ruminis DSM 5522 TaxID=1120918 RepID=A0A1I0V5C2_9FIRM|nr:tRNA (adenosine(37)-N6)-dimethylallyltransferase MiaA [Acetitomaculum ruminis]SFA71270.1 tRNA dimethylallyltransferase [Acetitomaculum ruminis DSM 5522]